MNTISIETAPRPADELRIGGLTRFTTIDFPNRLSAVVFVKGCPWDCLYCQNQELRSRKVDPAIGLVPWHKLVSFLEQRHGLIDGVVFSGGEPCADPAIVDAVQRVRAMGYQVGLHTGGMYPQRLKRLLPHLNWVGLDIKAPLDNSGAYERVVRRSSAVGFVQASLQMLLEAGIELETRTTAHPDYLSQAQLLSIARALFEAGVKQWVLQIYRQPFGAEPSELLERVGADYPSPETIEQVTKWFPSFTLRR